MSLELSEQELVRRDSLQKLKAEGIEPFPAALFPVDTLSKEVRENYEEGKKVIVAGRLMSKNIMGKASFSSIQDSEGRVQAYFNRDILCPDEDKSMYNLVYKKLLDIGDFVGVEGTMFTTKVGEKSIHVEKFTLLSKSLKPLPLPKTDSEGVIHDAFVNPNWDTDRDM